MKRFLAAAALVILAAPLAADEGAAIYKSKCAMCHGASGNGDTPMGKKLALKPLGSPEVQKKADAKIQHVIAKGEGKMPGFGEKLSEAQIKQLVTVVRGFAGK